MDRLACSCVISTHFEGPWQGSVGIQLLMCVDLALRRGEGATLHAFLAGRHPG
jgi:hypothetical protein